MTGPRQVGVVATTSLLVWLVCGCIVADGREVHLIPDGYVGPVTIVFGVPSGLPTATGDRGEVIYEIPRDGVLAVRDEAPPDGTYDMKFFYARSDGTREQLPLHAADDSLQVFSLAISGYARMNGRQVPGFIWHAYVVGVPAERGRNEWAKTRDAAVEEAVRKLSGAGTI